MSGIKSRPPQINHGREQPRSATLFDASRASAVVRLVRFAQGGGQPCVAKGVGVIWQSNLGWKDVGPR